MADAPKVRPRTVVLLQFTGIGDLIWHLQYFKLIAQHSHAGKVSIVAQPSTLARAFIGNAPWVESVIDHDHRPRREEGRKGKHAGLLGMYRMAQELKHGQFERIILFSGRNSRGLIAYLSGIPVRMGYGYRPLQRLFLNHGGFIAAHRDTSVAAYHEASAFMMAQGFCEAPVVPRIEPFTEQLTKMRARLAKLARPMTALVIGTSETDKQWGAENFAELARRMIEQGKGSVVLLGGEGESQLARDIVQRLPSSAQSHIEIITDASVWEAAAALQLVDVCVGNDTGMTNVAAAVRTPSFVLLGARPTLEHDPDYLHNIKAPQLSRITVDHVLRLLSNAPQKVRAHL